jgi:hypothetical protein
MPRMHADQMQAVSPPPSHHRTMQPFAAAEASFLVATITLTVACLAAIAFVCATKQRRKQATRSHALSNLSEGHGAESPQIVTRAAAATENRLQPADMWIWSAYGACVTGTVEEGEFGIMSQSAPLYLSGHAERPTQANLQSRKTHEIPLADSLQVVRVLSQTHLGTTSYGMACLAPPPRTFSLTRIVASWVPDCTFQDTTLLPNTSAQQQI